MSISLAKGQNLSLAKADASLKNLTLGLGWEARSTVGDDFDLDAAAILLGANGRIRSDADFVFYNQLGDVMLDPKHYDDDRASVKHQGDNRTGAGDGDDEVILIHLDRIPQDVERIVLTTSIHDAIKRKQSFGQVSDAFIRIVNTDTGVEVLRYDLTEDFSSEASLVFGELYRDKSNRDEWKFRAVGQGYTFELDGLISEYGVIATK